MRQGLLRGEGATILCPGCEGQHRSVTRIEGVPVLPCATVGEPGKLLLVLHPPSRGSNPLCYLVGPQPEPKVEVKPVRKSA